MTAQAIEAGVEPAPSRRLNFADRVLYGLGAIPFGIKDQGFQGLLLLYYNQVLGLSAVLTSAALLIALLADALIDPLIGHISDHWRSPRLGRRHPFLYFSALPIAISYFAVWNPPPVAGWALFAYLVTTSVLTRASISLYEIPSLALLPELTSDYDERTTLGSFRTFFAVAGGLAMTLVVFSFFLRPDASHPVGQLNPHGYFAYGAAAALLMGGLVLLTARGTQHLIPSLRAPQPARAVSAGQFFRELLQTISNRAILVMFASGAFAGIGLGMISGIQIYVTTYYWDMGAREIGWLSVGNVLGMLLAVGGAPVLCRLISKRLACMLMFFLAVVIGIFPGLLRELHLGPANHTTALIVILAAERVLGAACGISAGIIAGSMIADTVEEVELRTGRRSEGLLTAVNAFVAKAVSGFGVFFAGLAVSLVRFPANAVPGAVPAAVLSHLVFSYMLILVIAFGLSILCVTAYPVTRASHEATIRRLEAARASKG